MDHLKAMRVFERVAERASLAMASEDLGLSRGSASAIVSQLERHLGVQLLERNTRSLRLTEDGLRYLERARGILGEVELLEEEIGSAEHAARGRLRIQAPSGLVRLVIAPSLPGFFADHPQVELELLSRNSLPDFVGDQIDAALVVGELPELDIVARHVGRIPFVTVASPAYLARSGEPASPEDLARHACISALSTVNGARVPWRFRIGEDTVPVAINGPAAFESGDSAVASAVRGLGVLQLASYLVYDEIRAGRLRTILDGFRPPGRDLNIVHPRHRLKPKKLRVFEDFLLQLNLRTRQKWGIRQVD
ncbi:LysR family transcriptional regulator [Hoeflea marina]|uniref:LysR family transcriptional regulator n=1 Tax=Hoeflea marina TaxID=274592 RepID=A0A317PPJ8_9HYPH|nr:LysR family transcriptional regulator [Hoeflea marina]PWW03428.1 LysR family transcriptional regulator [Hoeflea marina]